MAALIRAALVDKIEAEAVEDLAVDAEALTEVAEEVAEEEAAAWAVVNGEDSVNLVDLVKVALPDMKWVIRITLTTTQSLCKAWVRM